MKSFPVLEIIQSLPKERLKLLEKFMQSPFWVTHKGAIEFFEYLKANQSDVTAFDKDKIAVALHIAPDRVYHLNNYVLEAVEKFLACMEWTTEPHRQHLHTVKSLRQLNLEEPAVKMLRYARRALDDSRERSTEWLQSDYLWRLESFRTSRQQGRAKDFNLQDLANAQDVAFIAARLQTGCLLVSHQTVARHQYDNGLLQPILNFLKGHNYLQIPIIGGYYHGYFALVGGDDAAEHFHQLKILLESHGHTFAHEEVHDLYLMAINFCIRRINQSEKIFIQNAFELYQSGLKQGALLENGILSRWTYNNIALAALHLKAFDWVEHFLTEYAPLLPMAHREGAFSLNMARFYYERRDLRTAMQHLLHREHDDVLQNLAAKTLLCRIYWELEAVEALYNQLDSIDIYLRRQKILGYHRNVYASFVKIMRKLLKINILNKKNVEQLRQEITATTALAEREWLLLQVI